MVLLAAHPDLGQTLCFAARVIAELLFVSLAFVVSERVPVIQQVTIAGYWSRQRAHPQSVGQPYSLVNRTGPLQ